LNLCLSFEINKETPNQKEIIDVIYLLCIIL
jgi:hypothetical protein